MWISARAESSSVIGARYLKSWSYQRTFERRLPSASCQPLSAARKGWTVSSGCSYGKDVHERLFVEAQRARSDLVAAEEGPEGLAAERRDEDETAERNGRGDDDACEAVIRTLAQALLQQIGKKAGAGW